jgi:hypothetical protein
MAAKGSHSSTTLRTQPRTFVIEKASRPSRIHMSRRSRESGSPSRQRKNPSTAT